MGVGARAFDGEEEGRGGCCCEERGGREELEGEFDL